MGASFSNQDLETHIITSNNTHVHQYISVCPNLDKYYSSELTGSLSIFTFTLLTLYYMLELGLVGTWEVITICIGTKKPVIVLRTEVGLSSSSSVIPSCLTHNFLTKLTRSADKYKWCDEKTKNWQKTKLKYHIKALDKLVLNMKSLVLDGATHIHVK